jgi:hypothetical protein
MNQSSLSSHSYNQCLFHESNALWLWRTIYLLKLPRFEKKLLVALDWTLDVLFSKDLVHFRTTPPRTPASVADSRIEEIRLNHHASHQSTANQISG